MATEDKYQRLASEYAKLRAQASVLKKAVLEEQARSSQLREQMRHKESTLRRTEQEVDSIGFRNKQLEHRVSILQKELATNDCVNKKERNKRSQTGSTFDIEHSDHTSINSNASIIAQEALIFEELQKKIIENAQLSSLINDKDKELQMHSEHIKSIETTLEKRNMEHSDMERRLRKDVEVLQTRNSELETKLVEAASLLGSEDAVSASGSDSTPMHTNHLNHQQQSSAEQRLNNLEKEIAHWRAKCELNNVYSNTLNDANATTQTKTQMFICSNSTSAASLNVPNLDDNFKQQLDLSTREQQLFNNLYQKYEELLKDKYHAESSLTSFQVEVSHLQNCLENATYELKVKDEQIESINQTLQLLEEDLSTTRMNYEEQISVLTEQVISLSEQLAASN